MSGAHDDDGPRRRLSGTIVPTDAVGQFDPPDETRVARKSRTLPKIPRATRRSADETPAQWRIPQACAFRQPAGAESSQFCAFSALPIGRFRFRRSAEIELPQCAQLLTPDEVGKIPHLTT